LASAETAQRADIKDSRNLPKEVLLLQGTNPNKFAVTALDGHKFAYTQSQTPAGPVDVLWLADPITMREWFNDEWKIDVTNWPPTISRFFSKTAAAMHVAMSSNGGSSQIGHVDSCDLSAAGSLTMHATSWSQVVARS